MNKLSIVLCSLLSLATLTTTPKFHNYAKIQLLVRQCEDAGVNKTMFKDMFTTIKMILVKAEAAPKLAPYNKEQELVDSLQQMLSQIPNLVGRAL
ncbi:MAG TPA: hypothetical protein QGF02_02485 [Candidatus Babeliales bacterium]|nr:hypothetical protein [Candidatus Babeliales bacterium]